MMNEWMNEDPCYVCKRVCFLYGELEAQWQVRRSRERSCFKMENWISTFLSFYIQISQEALIGFCVTAQ